MQAHTRRAHAILQYKFPDRKIIFIYGWSSGHHAFPAYALNANNMGPGGKAPVMKDGNPSQADLGPELLRIARRTGERLPAVHGFCGG